MQNPSWHNTHTHTHTGLISKSKNAQVHNLFSSTKKTASLKFLSRFFLATSSFSSSLKKCFAFILSFLLCFSSFFTLSVFAKTNNGDTQPKEFNAFTNNHASALRSGQALAPTADSGTWGGIDWSIDAAGTLTLSSAAAPEQGYTAGQLPSVELDPSSGMPTNIPWFDSAMSIPPTIQNISIEGSLKAGTSVEFLFAFTSITNVDALAKLDVSATTSMPGVFAGCSSLQNLDGLANWNVSNVTGERCMAAMFSGCSSLQNLDGLANWNVSNVTGPDCMTSMFQACSSLQNLDGLANWNVSSVTGGDCMQSMFFQCLSLQNLDGLSAWNVSNVTGVGCMRSMFQGCSGLTSIEGIASWNLAKAKSSTNGVYDMFIACPNISVIAGGQTDANGFVPTVSMALYLEAGNYYKAGDALPSYTAPSDALDDATWQQWLGTDSTARFMKSDTGYPFDTYTDLNVVWPSVTSFTYNTLTQESSCVPTSVTARNTSGTAVSLEYKKDYTLRITKQGQALPTALRDAGTYTVEVVPYGKSSWQAPASPLTNTATISSLSLASASVVASCVPASFVYDGAEHTTTVSVAVKLSSNSSQGSFAYLAQKGDASSAGEYSVTGNTQTAAGTYTATAQAASSNVEGSVSAAFAITKGRVLTFDGNGGKWSSGVQSVIKDVDISQATIGELPEAPVRTGYTFLGYFTEPAEGAGTQITADTALPTTDTIYYAHWTEGIYYRVTFNTDGGTPVPEVQQVKQGDKVTKPSDPTKQGYTFAGWYNGDAAWNFDSDTVLEDTTLTAHWIENPGPTPGPTPTPEPLPVPLPTPSENPDASGLTPEQQEEIIQGIDDIINGKVTEDQVDPYIKYIYDTYVKPYLDGKLAFSNLPSFLQDFFRKNGILPKTGDMLGVSTNTAVATGVLAAAALIAAAGIAARKRKKQANRS